jgi:predicted Fe-Mo cluster-binding NifX family protein
MASQGRLTEAFPKADTFVTKLFRGEITSFDVIRFVKRTYPVGDGSMMAQTDFYLR